MCSDLFDKSFMFIKDKVSFKIGNSKENVLDISDHHPNRLKEKLKDLRLESCFIICFSTSYREAKVYLLT